MSELGVVISTSVVDEQPTLREVDTCPRELLGLTCIKDQYACLCEQVTACDIGSEANEQGETTSVVLTLSLVPGMATTKVVMESLELTGLRADLQVSRQEVRATFNLRRPQNVGLREFVADIGL